MTVSGTLTSEDGDTIAVSGDASYTFSSIGSVAINGGTVTIEDVAFTNSGIASVSNGGLLSIDSPPLLGTGIINIATGGTVFVGDAGDFQQTIAFFYTSGTLSLGNPGAIASQITNFDTGDVIDLVNLPNSWVSYVDGKVSFGAAGANGKVTTMSLSLASDILTDSVIGAHSDGNGGTFLEIAPHRFWIGACDFPKRHAVLSRRRLARPERPFLLGPDQSVRYKLDGEWHHHSGRHSIRNRGRRFL